jgi:Flp pilus assembly protein TadG
MKNRSGCSIHRRRLRNDSRERGAVLVELALILPFLFLLICGIIEFGWAMSQHLDVRHGAREGARLVAVDYRSSSAVNGSAQRVEIAAETCRRARINAEPGVNKVVLQIPAQGAPVGDTGQRATIVVEKKLHTLTGFLDFALRGITLKSEVDTRLEQDATWATDNAAYSVNC